VLKEQAKLQRESTVQVKGGDSLFMFKNLLLLKPNALPWQKAPNEVK